MEDAAQVALLPIHLLFGVFEVFQESTMVEEAVIARAHLLKSVLMFRSGVVYPRNDRKYSRLRATSK